MYSLYSTEENDFEIEGQEWSVLTRQFKDSHFHNNVTDRFRQSIFNTECCNILHCDAEGNISRE